MVVKKDGGTTRKSKPIVKKSVVSKTGVEVKECYCRRCMKTKSVTNFMQATDNMLDKNGFMSICKDCIESMYISFFETDKSLEKTILRMCRLLNVKYSEDAINSTQAQLNTYAERGANFSNVFGIYKAKLFATQGTEIGKREDEDLTFHEPVRYVSEQSDCDGDESEEISYLKHKWGENYTTEDYQFLEQKYSEWEDSYSHATKAEIFILKELSHRELELRNARIEGKSVDPILKSIQSLLNDGGLKPIQAKAGDTGKINESWGSLIRQIEETTPAEYYKDKQLFKDYDQIEKKYILPFLVRSLKNFVLGSRDFNISEEDMNEEEYMNFEVDNGNESPPLE